MIAISSLPAKCKDCHRCIRSCSVNAIGFRHGQARIIPERCIVCGKCVTVCPQGATIVHNDWGQLAAWRKSGLALVASLAPSFPAAFPHLDPLQVIEGIKALGFCHVEETAYAASAVARHYRAVVEARTDLAIISSCCPVIVNMIEMYYPELLPNLAPTVSPMILHGQKLKERYPAAKVVFIGPCASKIDEIRRTSSQNSVDAVITFRQLKESWDSAGIDPSKLAPEWQSRRFEAARIYPLGRGILESSNLPTGAQPTIVSVSGIERCMEVFADLSRLVLQPTFVEALACEEGCVGGGEMPYPHSTMTRREAVIRYHEQCLPDSDASQPLPSMSSEWTPAPSNFVARVPITRACTDEEIRQVLLQIGQDTPEDARNCGGCGYDTCREKAIATLHGYAEPEMCVPFMRAKCESLSHLVVDSSPNAVIVANYDLTVHQFNAEARRIFDREGVVTKGSHLSELLDPVDFALVVATQEVAYRRVEYPSLGTVTSQVIYALPGYKLVVGIITDITDVELRRKQLDAKHQQTIQRASAVIRNQMKLAQEIAGLLGESTAETKATLLDLINSLTGDV